MSQGLTEAWFKQALERHQSDKGRGEDLRYDEDFIQVRVQNSAMLPDVNWMITKASELLIKSADLRVCIYGLHGTAMAGDLDGFIFILELYVHLIQYKFDDCYPEGDKQKLATFEWCVQSLIDEQLNEKKVVASTAQVERIKSSLEKIHQVIESKSGEPLRWRKLLDWLSNQTVKSVEPPQDPPKAPVTHEINSSKEARSLIEQLIKTLIKEAEYDKVIAYSRALKYSAIALPTHKDNRVAFDIHQSSLEKLRILYEKQAWEELWRETELMFMSPNAHFCFKLNYWSCQALINLGNINASDLIKFYLKKIYMDSRQILSLQYNGGILFCEAEVLNWIESFSKESENAESQSKPNILQCLEEKDVTTMKSWLRENPVLTKKDQFIHDVLHLKVLKQERKDLNLRLPLASLFERSLKEELHAWEPDLAKTIWQTYAMSLKEDKNKKLNQQEKIEWQAVWDEFTTKLTQAHLSTALEIMQQG